MEPTQLLDRNKRMKNTIEKENRTYESIKEFYGRKIDSNKALITTACCTDETASRFSDILKQIPEIVKNKSYGCGSPLPNEDLTGMTILDLGCGTGMDVFIASRLVGPEGKVIGIDITDEQLEIANKASHVMAKKFGYKEPNTYFYKDYIELCENIRDESIDLVISNCVINLSPRKDLVFKTIWRVLKNYGQFYISDIVCDRRLPGHITNPDTREYVECLSGAEYTNDLNDTMEAAGFKNVRIVNSRELEDKIGKENAIFYSVDLRGFKIPELDRRCEDYGQYATYIGGCSQQPVEFKLDQEHIFELERPMSVCRNTALMLSKTNLSRYFKVTEEIKHFGIFNCSPGKKDEKTDNNKTACC